MRIIFVVISNTDFTSHSFHQHKTRVGVHGEANFFVNQPGQVILAGNGIQLLPDIQKNKVNPVFDFEECPVDPAAQKSTQGQEQETGQNSDENRKHLQEARPEDDSLGAHQNCGDQYQAGHSRGQNSVQNAAAQNEINIQKPVPDHGEDKSQRYGRFEQTIHLGGKRRFQRKDQR